MHLIGFLSSNISSNFIFEYEVFSYSEILESHQYEIDSIIILNFIIKGEENCFSKKGNRYMKAFHEEVFHSSLCRRLLLIQLSLCEMVFSKNPTFPFLSMVSFYANLSLVSS